jgi:catechol 2,3-dioxygenase-like lactoylglutathione lyase family enzyme
VESLAGLLNPPGERMYERMIKGIAHVCFRVRNLEESIQFYHEALGFKHGFDFVNEKGERFGVYLHAGERTFVELFQGPHDEPSENPSYLHLCLEVDNIEGTVKALAEKGVEVTPVQMGSDHSWQAWLSDPDGNRIELHGYTPESKQNACLGRSL